MFNFLKKADKIDAFWNWFVQNKKQYESLEDDQDERLDVLSELLNKVESGLSIEISNDSMETHGIIISAEGDIDKFPIVKEIVAKAPFIAGWKVTAFRQPAMEDFTLEYEDIQLTPSQLYFEPVIEENALDIIIYGYGFKKHDFNELMHYGLIMLDNVMGEYNCVTKVRHYDFLDLEEAEDLEDLRPLPEINAFLEDFYYNKN